MRLNVLLLVLFFLLRQPELLENLCFFAFEFGLAFRLFISKTETFGRFFLFFLLAVGDFHIQILPTNNKMCLSVCAMICNLNNSI
jgi:hypothetical protein